MSPYKSQKQRGYMRANFPEIAKEWDKETKKRWYKKYGKINKKKK